VFLVVFALVAAAMLASALAWSGVGLIAFVPRGWMLVRSRERAIQRLSRCRSAHRSRPLARTRRRRRTGHDGEPFVSGQRGRARLL